MTNIFLNSIKKIHIFLCLISDYKYKYVIKYVLYIMMLEFFIHVKWFFMFTFERFHGKFRILFVSCSRVTRIVLFNRFRKLTRNVFCLFIP